MKIGDIVKVVCESNFNTDNDCKIHYYRKVGDVFEVISIAAPNSV